MKNDKETSKILEKSITEISVLLDNQEISSEELTNLVLQEIKKEDPKIKAFITVCEKEALDAAREADERIKANKRLSKLDGVPISIKDLICTKNIKTTAASKMLSDFISAYDATIVERIKNAGAVIVGKTNLDAWAHGSSTENSDFFTTHNPYDLERVAGGSSGGSTAAVAANLGFASIGTDTGGSIRQPAGFCNVVGLKPTYGRVSRYGIVAMASSLDQAGPIAKSCEDAAILLETICGQDKKDSTTVSGKKFEASKIQKLNIKDQDDHAKIENLRIGLPKEYFAKGLDPEIKERVLIEVAKLEKMGAKVKQISLPMTEYALAVYYILQPAEVSSNLARYDGIRYGYSVANDKSQIFNVKNLEELYLKNRGEGFGDEAKRRIMLGTYVLSSGYYDAYYKKAMKVRTLVCEDFNKAFEEVDVIITPTSPTMPFKIGEREQDPLAMYLADVYTVGANIAGIPALSVPVGLIDSLPVGLQILGPMWTEEKILNIGKIIENRRNA